MKNQLGNEIPASVFRAIHFSQPLNLRHCFEFFSIPEFVLASLTSEDIIFLEKKGKDGVSQIISRLERKHMENIEIIDLSASETQLPISLKTWAEGIFASEINGELAVYAGLAGTYDVLIRSNRTSLIQLKQIQLTPVSHVLLRSSFQFYWEEKYSIAFLGSENSYALYTSSGEGGGKGSARLLLKILTPKALYIDDAEKYIQTGLFLRGINI
jgi:hypothetical protein